jgi:hypothetical protein
MKPRRINYENQVADFRQNFLIDNQLKELMYKYENYDWVFFIEFTGGIQGSTDANVKAYTWDEELQKLNLVAFGTASQANLTMVA